MKLWLRKKALMALRAIVWHVDEWIQRQEVALREDIENQRVAPLHAKLTAKRAAGGPVTARPITSVVAPEPTEQESPVGQTWRRPPSESLSPSAEKRERHEARTESRNRNTKTRAIRYPHDAGRAAEYRQQSTDGTDSAPADAQESVSPHRHHESWAEWEARRAGIAPRKKYRVHRRRRPTAAEFDCEIRERRKEYIQ